MQPEVITMIVVGVLLAMFTAILAWQGKGRFDSLEQGLNSKIDAFNSKIDAFNSKIDALKIEVADVKTDVKQIRTKLGSIYATLVQVALAVNPQHRPEAG
jgi:outer membrane murein-binding lipoprotein Lpp